MVQIQTFGKYEIIRKRSRSMTDVYLAYDPELNRSLVIKVIEHSHDDFTRVVIEAERRGALIQKQLHALDRRILQIYDLGEHDGCFFVAMEYCAGRTLAEILRTEQRVDAKRAARYGAEICSQLRTLHSFVSDLDGRKAAVVHGDVKPSNIQIAANDDLKLLDFGIAKLITYTHNLTHHNLGSPSYCSPERLTNGHVDQHADLWALGVTLYELVAGAPPFQGENTRKLEELIQARRPPRVLPDSCPAAVGQVINKALAGDLKQRYQTAEAFEADLRAVLDNRPTLASRDRVLGLASKATVLRVAPNPTVSKSPKPVRPVKAVLPRLSPARGISNVTLALVAGMLAGLLLFMPIGYYYRLWAASRSLAGSKDYAHESVQAINADWKLYGELRHRGGVLGPLSPASSVDHAVFTNLVAGADNTIDGFRNSSDGHFQDFNWKGARLCLRYALQINPYASAARGKLALCDAYWALSSQPASAAAGKAAAAFRRSASFLPRWPDPHLGLAWINLYLNHNVGQAVAELNQAERLGYRLGPKEFVEQADGFLFRGESELLRVRRLPVTATQERTRWLGAAHYDLDHARQLYEPNVGFANVSASLDQIYGDQDEEAKLRLQPPKPAPHKAPARRTYVSLRRWR